LGGTIFNILITLIFQLLLNNNENIFHVKIQTTIK